MDGRKDQLKIDITVKALSTAEFDYKRQTESIQDFIKRVEKKTQVEKPLEQKTINIYANEPKKQIVNFEAQKFIIPTDLGFAMTPEQAQDLSEQLLAITQNPLLVMSLLKPANDDLGVEMSKQKLVFENDKPNYLLVGNSVLYPGCPSQAFLPIVKNHIFNTVFLKREMANGINLEGLLHKFLGIVGADIARNFIANAHTFHECKRLGRMVFHGSDIHRLMLEVFVQAIKQGYLKTNLTPVQLLQFLTKVKYGVTRTLDLWSYLFDVAFDQDQQFVTNVNEFCFSPRSPLVMNSLIICLGEQFGLNNLGPYLRNSFYNVIFEFVYRVERECRGVKFSKNQLYEAVVETMILSNPKIGNFMDFEVFSNTVIDEIMNDKYQAIDPQCQNVVKPRVQASEKVVGKISWKEFDRRLDQKIEKYQKSFLFFKLSREDTIIKYFRHKYNVIDIANDYQALFEALKRAERLPEDQYILKDIEILIKITEKLEPEYRQAMTNQANRNSDI